MRKVEVSCRRAYLDDAGWVRHLTFRGRTLRGFGNDADGHFDQFCPQIDKIGAILGYFRLLQSWTRHLTFIKVR